MQPRTLRETLRPLRLCVIFALLVYSMRDLELTHAVIGAAIDIHRILGPGLLEAVYEECLAKEFSLRGISYERQKPIPLVYKDLKLECGYRLDFLVSKRVVVEIKSIDAIAPIHETVMLTYLRLTQAPLGLLINFNVPVRKVGIRRYVWHYKEKEEDNAEAQSAAESRGEVSMNIKTGSEEPCMRSPKEGV
ncbi:MAG: GxxExxY protein [Candidatus Acidiferrum sp.]